jgi:hypothetical protein
MAEPQVVPKTYVLELSQADADIVHNEQNGDYTVTFAEPIKIDTGDQLALRMASIDSQKTDSQSVVFAEDQHIGMQFSYYDMNYEIREKDNPAGTPGPVVLNRQEINRPAVPTNFPVDYKMYIQYHEVATNVFELDDIVINYTGGQPTVDGQPLGSRGGFGYIDYFSLEFYFCFPLFSWTDPEGNLHTSVAKPYSLKASSDQTGTSYKLQPANTDQPDWKYTYLSYSTNKFGEGSTNWKPTMTSAVPGAAIPNYSTGKFGSEKIRFNAKSFKITGVTAGIMTSKTTSARYSNTYNEYLQVVNTYGTGNQTRTPITPPGGSLYQLTQGTAGTVLPAGRYDRNTLANLLTRRFTQVGITQAKNSQNTEQMYEPDTLLYVNTNDANYVDGIYRRILETDAPSGTGVTFDGTNSYTYEGSDPGTPANSKAVTLGARKFAIEYGQIGAAYQVSAAHQSVGNPNDLGKENVAFFKTGSGSVADPTIFHEITSATGIIINDLTPKPFWDEVLGLYDNWVVPTATADDGVLYFTKEALSPSDGNDKFPHESAEIVTFDPDNTRVNVTPTTTQFVDTATTPTYAVVGDSPVVNTEGTFYLLEIQGLNVAQSDFIDSDENMPNVSAVISKQYNANDIVTGFSDAGIPYVHRGAPQMISSARVRILDPTTKEVVTTLGNRNDVFLNLTTAAPIYNPQATQVKGMPKLPPKPKPQSER